MGYYINCIKQYNTLNYTVKELIPQMNMRRRMSSAVKMGVTTGIESLLDFEVSNKAENCATLEVDAIISATALGCIADSEKFLANVIEQKEQMVNPTPFIQSTFNTVGAQIALIKGMHCYNNTFSHRYISLESALIDAMIRLDSGASNAVLVVFFDEATSTVEKIFTRLNLLKGKELGEGAFAFVLTSNRCECSVAEITSLEFSNFEKKRSLEESEKSLEESENNSSSIYLSEASKRYWYGEFGEIIIKNLLECKDNMLENNANNRESGAISIINDIDGVIRSKIELLAIK